MAASATLALKADVWFRRGRLLIVSPDSLGTACPLSGRNSTYRPVQILEAGSWRACFHRDYDPIPNALTSVANELGAPNDSVVRRALSLDLSEMFGPPNAFFL